MARASFAPLLPLALLAALALLALPRGPVAVDARFLQAGSLAGGLPWVARDAALSAAAHALAARPEEGAQHRQRRSPQDDAEPAPPKPAGKPGFWRRAWEGVKKMAEKVGEIVEAVIEAISSVMDRQGARQPGKGGAAGQDNAETMSPDRLRSEPEPQR